MKKLMITLAVAVFAISVNARPIDVPPVSSIYAKTEGFETHATETVLTTATPTVEGGKTYLWYSDGAARGSATVKAYGENDVKLDGTGDKHLKVETTMGTPLYRKLVAHNNRVGVTQDSDSKYIGNGIYVDTCVQFTASEEAPKEIANNKLVVWVKETVDEEAGTSTKDLMVMAGQLNSSGVPTATNFVIDTTGKDLTGWHRLTIRAMVAREDGQNSIAAFTLFLDGEQLAAKAIQVPGKEAVYEEDGVTVKEETVAEVDYETLMGTYAVKDLSAEAKKFYEKKQLFYSLVGTDKPELVKQISAVGFEGSGQIDNVTITTTAPRFARGYFTISWDEGVKSFVVKNGDDEEVYSKSGIVAAGKEVFLIPENTVILTITVTEYNEGFSGGNGAVSLTNERSYFIDTIGEKPNPVISVSYNGGTPIKMGSTIKVPE